MSDVGSKPDMSCVPYRRKGLYLALTIPFLALLVLIFAYLWTYSLILSLGLLVLYLLTCYFQAYCCAYQDCPYVGGFCPAIAGIVPASLLAKLIYGKKPIAKTKTRFELHATLGIVSLLSLMAFPLPWIARLGIPLAVAYVVGCAVYYVTFWLTICPACAIRDTCPGGKFHKMFLRRDSPDT